MGADAWDAQCDGVDQQHLLVVEADQGMREIEGNRGFPYAALGVRDRDRGQHMGNASSRKHRRTVTSVISNGTGSACSQACARACVHRYPEPERRHSDTDKAWRLAHRAVSMSIHGHFGNGNR